MGTGEERPRPPFNSAAGAGLAGPPGPRGLASCIPPSQPLTPLQIWGSLRPGIRAPGKHLTPSRCLLSRAPRSHGPGQRNPFGFPLLGRASSSASGCPPPQRPPAALGPRPRLLVGPASGSPGQGSLHNAARLRVHPNIYRKHARMRAQNAARTASHTQRYCSRPRRTTRQYAILSGPRTRVHAVLSPAHVMPGGRKEGATDRERWTLRTDLGG